MRRPGAVQRRLAEKRGRPPMRAGQGDAAQGNVRFGVAMAASPSENSDQIQVSDGVFAPNRRSKAHQTGTGEVRAQESEGPGAGDVSQIEEGLLDQTPGDGQRASGTGGPVGRLPRKVISLAGYREVAANSTGG